jgi:hypothetical protein
MCKAVEEFDIRSARCYCESDRQFVQTNVRFFMVASRQVSPQATFDETLDAFNDLVKQRVPAILRASMPRCGIPYKLALATFLAMLVFNVLDITEAAQQGVSARLLVIQVVATSCMAFLVLPNILAVYFRCSFRAVSTKGMRMRGLLLWQGLAVAVQIAILGAHFALVIIAERGSDAAMIGFVFYGLGHLAAAIFFYTQGNSGFFIKGCVTDAHVSSVSGDASNIQDVVLPVSSCKTEKTHDVNFTDNEALEAANVDSLVFKITL